MSILSQIGILILIGCIIFILVRSNKTLEKAAEEGEHFVDEWALRQQKKEERLLEKEEREQERKERLREKREQRLTNRKTKRQEELWDAEADDDWDEDERWEEESDDEPQDDRWRADDDWTRENDQDEDNGWEAEKDRDEESGRNVESGDQKIISMHEYRNPGITLVQLDETHRPVLRTRVTKLPFTIGRSPENVLVLDDLCVARKHCRIVERDGSYVLEDVGTANKLFYHGQITDHIVLGDQLTFYIGNVEFRVEMGMSRSGHTSLYQRAGERYYE